MSEGISRRSFLSGGVGLGLAGAALPGLLSACGGNAVVPTSAGKVVLPDDVPAKVPTPQEPGTSAGVRDGYWQYPSELVKSVHDTPGRGGSVTALVIAYVPPPTPLSQNQYWQQLNRNLGVSYQPIITAEGDFPTKLQTVMAASDLPDYILLTPTNATAHLIEFLEDKCEDLSPYLAGSAVKAYPNLANLGNFSWNTATYGGRIYGLPQPRGVFGSNLFILQNLADDAGMSQPKNVDDLERLMKELNQPKAGRWAMGAATLTNYNLSFFYQLFGVPNGWAVDRNGKFTADLETEAAREAIAYARRLFQDGVFHPDANNMTTVQAKDAFYAGQIASYLDGFSAYPSTWEQVALIKPDNKPRVMIPFGHSGGRGSYFFGTGSFGTTALKKAPKSRIEELLRIADYLAAPFGTEENFFLANGVEGVDFTRNAQGAPIVTSKGQTQNALSEGYITSGPSVNVNTQFPDFIRAIHQQEEQLVPLGVVNPTVGLYSETAEDRGSDLATLVDDQLSSIIAGRAPISSLTSLISNWKSQGGEQMRNEYQKSYETNHK